MSYGGYTWSFQQLGGPEKLLQLSGYAAPFGRERSQKPLLKELIKSRVKTTRYPGSSAPPTRHIFGTHWEDMEISGRWMTKTLAGGVPDGQGQTIFMAHELAQEWSTFVRDEQLVRMSWGFVFSFTVFIEELELAHETEGVIAWRMKLLVDSRDDAAVTPPFVPPPSFTGAIADINTFVTFVNNSPQLQQAMSETDGDFLDNLNLFIGNLNQYSAAFNKLAGQIDDLEKAAFSQLMHLRSALTGFQNAILQLRETAVDATIDSIMAVRTAESDIAWIRYQAALDDQTVDIASVIADLQSHIDTASTSIAQKVITAQDGDTWESLSTRAGKGVDGASAIRALAGARYGELPVPGNSYLVPS